MARFVRRIPIGHALWLKGIGWMLIVPQQASSPRFLSSVIGVFINSLKPPPAATPFLPSTNTLDRSIMAQTSHIQSVSFGDGNTGCGNVNNISNTFYLSDEDERILRWLSPLEPNHRHKGVRTDRFEGVGEGLLETREFREWRGSEEGSGKEVLFCSGNPGVGKTYLR